MNEPGRKEVAVTDLVLPIDPKRLVKEERILYAAIKVFSQYPFAVATVKMIADEAELPVSAVMYHYKSKENLYEAVFERLMPYRRQSQEQYRRFLEASDKIDRKAARQMVEEYLGDMIDGFYGDEKKDWYVRVLFFEWLHPSPLYGTLYEKYFKENAELFIHLLKVATGDDDHERATMQTIGIMGHLISFRLLRELLVRQTPMAGFNKEEKEKIKALVIRNTMLMLQIEE